MINEASAPLWEPERHTELLDTPWDEGTARFAIEAIVADARSSFSPKVLWPRHPNDGDAGGEPWRNLYFGAAGVVWALDYLAATDACAAGESFGLAVQNSIEPNRSDNAWFGDATTGLLLGDTGILITQWRISRASEVEDALAEAILATANHPALEFMWGSPGTLLAALAMYDGTGETRWADLVRTSADALERALVIDDVRDCRLWIQDLYGSRVKLLGAVHGFAGSAFVLNLSPASSLSPVGKTFIRFRRDYLRDCALVGTTCQLASKPRAATPWANWLVGATLSWGPWSAHFASRAGSTYRRSVDRCWRDDLARRTFGEGREPLPRHWWQRLCVPEAVRTNR